MLLSIIVPVYNASKNLAQCLSSLASLSRPNTEIIVVDDASTDDSPEVAKQIGARVLSLAKNSGPAAARNFGARAACGEFLFFIDADVVLAPDALNRVVKAFAEQPDLAAVFGSYDSRPQANGVVSQYKNLLHHFVHQNGDSEASTFWAGCGAIRRSVFEAIGGFNETRFPYPSIEDIELGYRLRQAGYRILLDKTLQGTHLKSWNLRSLIRTDITRRAVPWSRLILETKKAPDDLNLKWDQRASFAVVLLACISLALALRRPEWLAVSVAALLAVAVINRQLYAFFLRQRGILFTAACVPLHLLYYLYAGLTYLYIWGVFQLKRVSTFQAGSILKAASGHLKLKRD